MEPTQKSGGGGTVGVGDSGFIVHAGCTPPHNRSMKFPLLLALMLALSCQVADARIKRSQSAKVAFKQQHPCPALLAHAKGLERAT